MLGHADCVNSLLEFHAAPWARNAELEMPFELALRFGFAELANALAGYQPAPPLTSQVTTLTTFEMPVEFCFSHIITK